MSAIDSAVCRVCRRNPDTTNSNVAECSHVDCPHRRTAWSERPRPHVYDEDKPHPLDNLFDKEQQL